MEKIKKDFNPKVSIVIPVYNGANYMREAINSALNQTYRNVEVIVVNDGSNDETEEIAKSYGNKIRYFSKENGGVATALNLAIKKAEGAYISWLSHDDVYYLDKIEKQINKLAGLDEENLYNTILISNYSVINEKSKLIAIQEFQKTHDLQKLNYPLYPLLNGIVHGCTLLIPKDCFNKIGYFDEKLKATQDYDLWFRMFPNFNMLFMDDMFVKSRVHKEQGTKKIKTANQECSELWIKMVDNLTKNQKIIIGDSVISFYQKTLSLVKGAGYFKAEKHISEIIKNIKNRDITKIKVSIIIPFYNRIEYTTEAINSVIAQTHTNIELLIINDYSTDDIGPIENIIKNDNRILLINNTRSKGVAGARNTGIDNATGEYVAFLDSDDLFLPDKIKKQLEFMVRGGFLFSHTSYFIFNENKKKNLEMMYGKRNCVYPNIICNCFIATPTVMIDVDLMKNKKIRFPEGISLGEDVCLWIRVSKISLCSIGLNEMLTKVRDHGSNASYDKEKQVVGINNIINYVILNFLNQDTIKPTKKLIHALTNKLSKFHKKENTILNLKNKLIKILK